jgi:hypothetical protein
MTWFALPHLDEDDTIVLFASQHVYSSVINDVFNISLVSVDNQRGPIADITSRLSIRVDGINNGTNVSCITVSRTESRIILKQAPPAPSSFVTNVTDYLPLSVSVIVSWIMPDHTHVDGYKIVFNTSKETIVFTNNTQVSLEVDYKRVLIYTISAFNCYGHSEDVADEIFIVGCAPPSPPVNGSVSEFTSARVGAQVTYSCDTDLALVGETVATCSLPSLQWMPSIDDVSCIQPPECGNPTEYLQANVSIRSLNSSVVTVSCNTGYVLYGSKTSECVHGEWFPSLQTILCFPSATVTECSFPNGVLESNVTILGNKSFLIFSCDLGFGLYGSTISHCVSGEWIPSPDSVTCRSFDVCPTSGSNSEKNSPAEILAIIALVGAVCGFTTGLLLCVLMTRCYVHFCGKEKRCQTEKTERAHFYEDIPLQNTSAAEPVQLKTNEAYGHF